MKSFEYVVYTLTSKEKLSDEQLKILESLGTVTESVCTPEYHKSDPYLITSFEPNKDELHKVIYQLVRNDLNRFVDERYPKRYQLDFVQIYEWMVMEYPVLEDNYQLCRDIFEAWIPESYYHVKEWDKNPDCMYDTRYILEYDRWKHTNHYPY